MKYVCVVLFLFPCLCLAQMRSGVYIDSLLASPSAGEEWVVLKNQYQEEVSMTGWKLCDKTNKCVKLSGTIPAQKTHSIKTSFLNNTGDTVTLVDACDQAIDTVTYPSMKKDIVWYRDVTQVTESKKEETKLIKNVALVENKKETSTKLLPWIEEQAIKLTSSTVSEVNASTGLELIVNSPWGLFEDKMMYAQTKEKGYQLSFGSKVTDLPTYEVGDVIQVTGEQTEKNGKSIIKITSPDQIIRTGEQREELPLVVKPGEVTQEHLGMLVQVSGLVQQKSAYGFLLHKEEDVAVGLKKRTGLSFTNIKKQQDWKITGIVEQKTDGSLVIWPRFEEDMQRMYQEATTETVEVSEILAQVQENRFWMYLSGFILMGIGMFGYLGYKYRYLWQKQESVDETP